LIGARDTKTEVASSQGIVSWSNDKTPSGNEKLA